MRKFLLDTNLLLRFLTSDDHKKAKAVANLLKTSKDPLIVTDLAFAELAWVMASFYDFDKEQNIDFIDAYHAAYASLKSFDVIYSYDKDFDKVKGVKRIEPSK